MARAFILSPKLSDLSAVTASTAVANASAVNILRSRPKLFWRTTTNSGYIEGNFGIPTTVDTLAIGYCNANDASDLGHLRLASSQANLTSAPGFNSGVFTIWPNGSDLSAYLKPHRVLTFTPQTYQWYRFDLNFVTSGATFVQLSRLMLGKRIEPNTSIQEGWSLGGEEPVAETTDMGGEESPRIMGVRRSHTVTWANLLESEREQLYTTLLERGSAKDICLAIEGSEGEYAMSRVFIGRVKHAFSFPQVMLASDGVQRFTVQVTVTELAPIEMA